MTFWRVCCVQADRRTAQAGLGMRTYGAAVTDDYRQSVRNLAMMRFKELNDQSWWWSPTYNLVDDERIDFFWYFFFLLSLLFGWIFSQWSCITHKTFFFQLTSWFPSNTTQVQKVKKSVILSLKSINRSNCSSVKGPMSRSICPLISFMFFPIPSIPSIKKNRWEVTSDGLQELLQEPRVAYDTGARAGPLRYLFWLLRSWPSELWG